MKQPELPSLQPAPGENLQNHYIKRLERLLRLRHDFAEDLNPLGLELLEKSIEATFRDCVANGAARPAKSLLQNKGDQTS